MTVSVRDVSNLISQLKCGQAAGSDDLCAEHLKFANDKLHTLLSMCFTFFYTLQLMEWYPKYMYLSQHEKF